MTPSTPTNPLYFLSSGNQGQIKNSGPHKATQENHPGNLFRLHLSPYKIAHSLKSSSIILEIIRRIPSIASREEIVVLQAMEGQCFSTDDRLHPTPLNKGRQATLQNNSMFKSLKTSETPSSNRFLTLRGLFYGMKPFLLRSANTLQHRPSTPYSLSTSIHLPHNQVLQEKKVRQHDRDQHDIEITSLGSVPAPSSTFASPQVIYRSLQSLCERFGVEREHLRLVAEGHALFTATSTTIPYYASNSGNSRHLNELNRAPDGCLAEEAKKEVERILTPFSSPMPITASLVDQVSRNLLDSLWKIANRAGARIEVEIVAIEKEGIFLQLLESIASNSSYSPHFNRLILEPLLGIPSIEENGRVGQPRDGGASQIGDRKSSSSSSYRGEHEDKEEARTFTPRIFPPRASTARTRTASCSTPSTFYTSSTPTHTLPSSFPTSPLPLRCTKVLLMVCLKGMPCNDAIVLLRRLLQFKALLRLHTPLEPPILRNKAEDSGFTTSTGEKLNEIEVEAITGVKEEKVRAPNTTTSSALSPPSSSLYRPKQPTAGKNGAICAIVDCNPSGMVILENLERRLSTDSIMSAATRAPIWWCALKPSQLPTFLPADSHRQSLTTRDKDILIRLASQPSNSDSSLHQELKTEAQTMLNLVQYKFELQALCH